jgi:non-specific serine/threonine protein kinase
VARHFAVGAAIPSFVTAVALTASPAHAVGWEDGAPVPVPRTEVAAATLGDRVVVVGGFLADGATTARADLYQPARDRWSRLPSLPLGLNHAAAATWRDTVVVAGGYAGRLGGGAAQRVALILRDGRWQRLPRLPEARAAAGAAVLRGTLYVVGGVGPSGLARDAFALELAGALEGRSRWRRIPGPTPREHLAVAAYRGRVFAIAGRTAGIDTNLALVEAYDPVTGRWRPRPPVPGARGGTGAAVAGGLLVSVGGEEPAGTIAPVFAYDGRSWSALPELPTPRHGLGVVGLGGRVYALAGGPEPGLTVSAAVEVLTLA